MRRILSHLICWITWQFLKYFPSRAIVVEVPNTSDCWNTIETFYSTDSSNIHSQYHDQVYETELGKWLRDHPWHVIAGRVKVPNLTIWHTLNQMDLNPAPFQINTEIFKVKFLREDDAAMFKLMFAS